MELPFMIRNIHTLQDVIDWNMCVGCGTCAAFCEVAEGVIMQDWPKVGIRPMLPSSGCGECRDCLEFCPGFSLDVGDVLDQERERAEENLLVGSYHGVFLGYSADDKLRHKCSSGGVLTSLAAYCLEHLGMRAVVHTGMDPEQPWKNCTVISRTRQDLLDRSGSRYCSSSPCEFLNHIEASDGPCVFIGKPCDVAALTKARRQRPRLDVNVGLALSFFCAGTPCSESVINYAERLGASREKITELRFRGDGWPGRFRVTLKDLPGINSVTATGARQQTTAPDSCQLTETYMNSWRVLAKHRPFRCHICPDGLGQFADIVSGDAWNRYRGVGKSSGYSHVIVRTARGREILAQAERENYIRLQPVSVEEVMKGQGLVYRHAVAFGRILGVKLTGVPTTEFHGFNLFKIWVRTNPLIMVRSILGTVRRMVARRLFRKGASCWR